MRAWLWVLLWAGLAGLNSGCASRAATERAPSPVIVWPSAPETPRISFVDTISEPADIGIREGALRSFLRFLSGKQSTPVISPHGLVVDAAGRLYVVDNFLRKVHVYDQRAGKYRLFPEREPALVSPVGIAIDDRSGLVYVTDTAAAVVWVFAEGGAKLVGEIRGGDMQRPTGVAVNAATSELLVVDALNPGILRYGLPGHEFKGIIGGEGTEAGSFHSPTHIVVTPDGQVLVTDALNFRIQILNEKGGFMRAFGSPGDSPGEFARPKGIAVDSDGNVYVVDALFDNVQVFDRDGRLLMAFGQPGQAPGEFWLPSGIFIDSRDRIYVSDSYNKRVQVFQYLADGRLP
ncbi:MAG: 6-bladed beta-propeller [Steroidobacteraceae bacterium]